ncbi:hypothetical protein RHSIM_Rhsim07G0177800 [Rhododendron simsii]|uniref:Uncharacterized protein n=1 Tax=Rhododendron simsii TaxID=118357 RepID=A0A834LK98_RHOSS|nr:hypothetical protein RHSIM_Rhsim07G0177800 [Rhododendron simsii]
MATDLDRCTFTFIIILSAIPIIFSGYFLINTLVFLGGDPVCDHPRVEWDFRFGIFLLVLSVAGSIGTMCRSKGLLMACLTILGTFIAFILVVSRCIERGGTYAEDSKRIDSSYRLDNYAPWAVKFLLKDDGWTNFRNCLDERNICEKKLDDNNFYENGCCAPPQYCGFQDKNQSWVIPESGFYAKDVNCVTWSSEKTKLCHECETCQAVYVYVVTFNWHLRGIWLMFGIVVWVMCLGFTCEHEKKQRQQRNNRTN